MGSAHLGVLALVYSWALLSCRARNGVKGMSITISLLNRVKRHLEQSTQHCANGYSLENL